MKKFLMAMVACGALAGCAAGQEPYSVAMLLAEMMDEEAFRQRVSRRKARNDWIAYRCYFCSRNLCTRSP